jgi:hypothetical protein
MKNILTIIIIFFFAASHVFGATPTDTPTIILFPTEESKASSLTDQINDLKNKIASRVAELNLVDKRGIVGTVKEVKSTQITIVDPQEKTRIIDIDGITKFSSPSAKSTFGISDVTPGSHLSVIGLYNKQSRRILARFVESATPPIFINGVINEVNKVDFTFSVINANSTTTIVDVENITRTNTYTAIDDMVKTGFTKISTGDRVIVTGYPNKSEKNRVTGVRVLLLPEAPKVPGISVTVPEVIESVTGTPVKRKTPTP